jgi:hypothetical protein
MAWKTVRVFISSTFRDMHAARDHLVKVVFPELRERMAGRHLYLVDIDLRWGITEGEAELDHPWLKEHEGHSLTALEITHAVLRNPYLVERGELVGFFHRQLAEAVTARYPERRQTHAKLAAYFAGSPLERKLDEHPYQFQHAEDWQALAAALGDLDFLEQAWDRDRPDVAPSLTTIAHLLRAGRLRPDAAVLRTCGFNLFPFEGFRVPPE